MRNRLSWQHTRAFDGATTSIFLVHTRRRSHNTFLQQSANSKSILAKSTMCRKLIQIYACGHTKTICTTACPHAIETGRQVPQVDNNMGLTRSISTVSTLVASPILRGQTPAHSRSPTAPRPSIDSQRLPQALLPNQPRSSLERPSHGSTSPTPSYTKSTSPAPTLTTSPSIAFITGHFNSEEIAIEIEPNFCPYYFPHNLPASHHPCTECFVLPEWVSHFPSLSTLTREVYAKI